MRSAQANTVIDLGATSLNKMRSAAYIGFAVSAKGNMDPKDITSYGIALMKQKAANTAPTAPKPAQPQATVFPAKIQEAIYNSKHAAKVVNAETFRRSQGATPMHDAERWKRTAIGEHKRFVAMRSAMKVAAQGLTPQDRVFKPRFGLTPEAPMPAAPAPRMGMAA